MKKIFIAIIILFLSVRVQAKVFRQEPINEYDIVLIKSNGTRKYYSATANSNTARGDCLESALTVAEANDEIQIGRGEFYIDWGDFSYPNNVTYKGSSRYDTKIKTSPSTQSSIGGNTSFSNLTFDTNALYACSIPDYNANIYFENIDYYGTYDFIYMFSTTRNTTVYLRSCNINDLWDNISGSCSSDANNLVIATDCNFTSYSESPDWTNNEAAKIVNGISGKFYNCRFTATNYASNPSSVCAFHQNSESDAYFYNCTFSKYSIQTPSQAYCDIRIASTADGNVYLSNCSGSGTNGEITSNRDVSRLIFLDVAPIIQAINDANNKITSDCNFAGTIRIGEEVTGNVTFANMKISAVDGTAFVDFGAANVLTDYIGRFLTIKDSEQRSINGWIKAAGTGETYDSTILTNGTFDADTSNWAGTYADLASIAGGQSNNCLEVTQNGKGTAYATTTDALPVLKKLWQYSAYVKSGTSGNEAYKLVMNSAVYQSGTSSGSWVQDEGYYTNKSADYFKLYKNTTTAGTMLFDEAVVRQVLTPSATGVTIVTEYGGDTYNWYSQDASFDFNDTLGYSYIISPYFPNSGKFCIGAGDLAAGTAPIKIGVGSLNTTPEVGAFEYDGANLYFVDANGTRWMLTKQEP